MKPTELPPPEPISANQLAVATAGALIAAIIILVVAVLPAEYGIDPLHTGAAMGLGRGSETPTAQQESATPAQGDVLKPELAGLLSKYGASYKVDRAQFILPPYQFVEYKYQMAESATMLFSWEASAPVIQDFHGARAGAGTKDEVSLDKQTRSRMSGGVIAPFDGMHGWYWENPGGTRITITLSSAGFYNSAIEYRSDRTRHVHPLGSPQAASDSPER